MKVFLICAILLSFLMAGAAEPIKREWQAGWNTEIRQDETIAKIAHDLMDEGVRATRHWKEYCANPSAKGDASLLVVFGGRNSVQRDGGHSPAIPLAIEMALDWVRNQQGTGKIVVLVPEMLVERAGGRAGRHGPSASRFRMSYATLLLPFSRMCGTLSGMSCSKRETSRRLAFCCFSASTESPFVAQPHHLNPTIMVCPSKPPCPRRVADRPLSAED